MKYTAIRSEGGLLPYDLLDEILAETAPGQKAPDFGLPKGRRVSDEIQRVWLDAQELWSRFKVGRQKLTDKDPHGTTLTRDRWIGPMLTDPVRLSYDLHFQPSALVLDGLTFTISHRAGEPNDSPPVHIEGCGIELDKRPQKSRVSPQAMVQEFLNRSESLLWGVVTNGLRFRLLRDSVRTARPSYLEFDLETILEGGHYNEFVLFYRLCHRTRLPQAGRPSEDCWLEKYYQLSVEKGGRVRDNLRDGVEEALKVLGTGFLRHPENTALQENIDSGKLNADQYHRQLLLLVYRLLFLTVAEDRHLVISIGESAVRNQAIYQDNYSIGKLRERAEGLLEDSGFSDLWVGLTQTFKLFADSNDTNPLGIPPLNGDLFSHTTIPDLETARLSNLDLLKAVRWLMFYRERNVRQRVNYAALDVEELGSVYESLLDFRPVVSKEPEGWKFDLGVGSERKTTGSYYTRPELVRELIQSALVPVFEDRLAEVEKKAKGKSSETIREAKVKTVLGISVCDPACGSGHFLLEAARRLGKELARIRVGEDEPTPEQFHVAVRDVISHCIYGVDQNPLAVDLCKLALWIEGHWAGKPLSFLDHRIRCGNSLIGVLDPAIMADGIPDEAFTPVVGDDKAVAAAYKKRNKAEKALGQKRLEFEQSPTEHSEEYAELFGVGLDFPEDKPSDVRKKAELFAKARSGVEWWHDYTAANLWTAAFFVPLTKLDDPLVPTQDTFLSYFVHRKDRPQMTGAANSLAGELRFLHWHLEFPEIFANGGFDVVLGNPPWEKLQSEELQWFATRAPLIARLAGTARKNAIAALDHSNPALAEAWRLQRRSDAAVNRFMKSSQRYLLTGTGKFNSYALFAELCYRLLSKKGRSGIIVPSGIATDDTTKKFFQDIINHKSLIGLYDFENALPLFADVHRSFKFCLLTLCSGGSTEPADFVFFAHQVADLRDAVRHFSLSSHDISRLNPNTRTCPLFRSYRDADLTKRVYTYIPPIEVENSQNSWSPNIRRILNETDDAGQFLELGHLTSDGWKQTEHGDFEQNGVIVRRVYEAKMMWQFDHRFGTYRGHGYTDCDLVTNDEHADSRFCATPRYWYPALDLCKFFDNQVLPDWSLVFRRITNITNERTIAFAILPKCATGTLTPLVNLRASTQQICCFLAEKNSFVFDYISRQKISGTDVNIFKLKQLPSLEPQRYEDQCEWYRSTISDWLVPRALELTYTAQDLESFAQNCGWTGPPFRWDEERRFVLRCELDAAFFHLYFPAEANGGWRQGGDLAEDMVRLTASFPTPRDAVVYIMETFPITKRKDEEEHGAYRTKQAILDIYDAMAEAVRSGNPYQTRLNPGPADQRCCDIPREDSAGNIEVR